MEILRLAAASLLPVLLAAGFYLAEKRTAFARWPYLLRQGLIGAAFGGLAVLSTEFGVPIDGAVINVRDAAPLCAGLIFGGPAGIFAGVIGGVERWLSVYWGGGAYTRLACTLATIFAGLFAAALRRHLFDDKKPSWFYGLAIGLTTEVLHMLMIFFTNMADIHYAFSFVEKCALPMISLNGLSVMLAVMAVSLLSKERLHSAKPVKKIAQTFQRWLLVCVVVAFVVTSAFTFVLQTRIVNANADNLLTVHTQDVRADISDASDKNLLKLTRRIALQLPLAKTPDRARLLRLAQEYSVAEINIVDSHGIIRVSTNPDFVGFNMGSGEQSRAFMPLLYSQTEIVQSYQPIAYAPDVWRKYAGVALNNGTFVQVGYDAEQFQKDMRAQVEGAAKNRHIGADGSLIICDENWTIVSDRKGYVGQPLSAVGMTIDTAAVAEHTRFFAEAYGSPCLCAYTLSEGYYIIALLPQSEAVFARNIAVYVAAFMEVVVFAALFCLIYFLIKKLVVDNIQRINRTLAEITNGNLDVTVDVRANEEFASLSDDINSTVVTLKRYIAEAAARIDKELEFARAIQRSALPSVFPPFPGRRDFDIYARMDAAKEVGGDFYDFYLLDKTHLAFLIADVSGKGIPAAMFMMTAKTMLKSLAESGMPVDKVFTKANEKLCEGNEAGMFVTAWMGVLDLSTGLLRFADAGHNPPLLRHGGGAFAYLQIKPNFVLAGLDGVKYRQHELTLLPGDTLFLYTDGVTEATDANQRLFSEPRLLGSLNGAADVGTEGLCAAVKAEVDAFVGDAPQFDDITMLALRLHGLESGDDIQTFPDEASVPAVSAFVEARIAGLDLPQKQANRVRIALDEIYTNIRLYSGATRVRLRCRREAGALVLTFRDNGTPYDPLGAKKPDVTAPLEERAVGGLGIYMVEKLMDGVSYAYEDGENVLTLTLRP